jgi:phosphonate transport system permease protein
VDPLVDYSAAGIAVWFIAITVAILDYISAEIRARYCKQSYI